MHRNTKPEDQRLDSQVLVSLRTATRRRLEVVARQKGHPMSRIAREILEQALGHVEERDDDVPTT